MNEILSQKLTIVIFSYNRHEYLIRTINYWLNYNVKLLVLDGSSTKLEDECLQNKNVEYKNKIKCIYERLYFSSDYIKTEFMVLAGDDEFYLPSALTSCINFLIKEKSYSSCGGRVIGFNCHNNGQEIFGYEQYPGFKNFCLNHNDPIKRIKKHFSNYEPAHFYSVRRSKNWRQISKHIFKKNHKMDANIFQKIKLDLMEMELEFLVLISGKSKIIPELMWLRNKELNPISENSYQSCSIEKWWNNENYQKDINNFLYKIKKACDEILMYKNPKITKSEISKLFDIYFNSYFCRPKVKKKIFKRILDLITNKKIIHFFPIKIVNFIKKITFWKKYVINNNTELIEQAQKLQSENVLINYNELKQVISTIKKFRVNKPL